MIVRETTFLLAALVALTAGQSLTISPAGDVYTRALQDTMLMTCTVIGVDPDFEPNLKWYDDDDREITTTTGRVYIDKQGLSLKLYITSIENQDAGTYTCEGDIAGIQRESLKLEIFMDITFKSAPSPQNPRIYDDALIECIVDGQPKPVISWRYRGNTITTGGHYSQEDNGLRIMNATREDDGQYECRAEVVAEGRYDARTITVNVHIPPTITDGVSNQEGIEGQEGSLTCGAESLPDPKYYFYKDGNQNAVESSERIKVDEDKGVIDFRPLIKGDEGDYRCEATNDVGTAEDTGFLKVLVPPRIHTLVNQTGIEGQSVVLTCICDADPAPNMVFHKMGNPEPYQLGQNDNGKVLLENPSHGRLDMEVMNLHPDDTDNYTCIATNEAGEHKVNGTVIVRYHPRFANDHPTEFYLWAGKTRNLTCASQAEPEPKIRWYMYENSDSPLTNNETFKIYEMGKNSNLQITCREEDQGWIYGDYTCVADNGFTQKGEVDLNVIRATLPAAPTSATIKESSPTHLVLTVEPPEDNGGIEVFAYRVEYETTSEDFGIEAKVRNGSAPIRIENLKAGTQYRFKIRAKNEVGVGNALDFDHQTDNIREPYPIVLIPAPAEYAYEYRLRWEAPRTGGMPIIEYEIKTRKVTVTPQGTVDQPLDDWTRTVRKDDKDAPITSYELKNLSPETHYEVKIRADNGMGYSDYNHEFTFQTVIDPEGTVTGKDQASVVQGSLGTGAVIGIVIVVFLIFLVVVDVSCYFMNSCGVLMCLCVSFCGKPQRGSKEKQMEEGESKEALKQPVEEAVVAQEQDVVSEEPPSTEKKEEPADEDQQAPPPAEAEEDEKKPLSEESGMEELEPEDKEEKDEVIDVQVKDEAEEVKDAPAQEEDVEIEADEKTPLKDDPAKPEVDASDSAPPSEEKEKAADNA